jgi:hypothetical protein
VAVAAIALAVLVRAPLLAAGFVSDDFVLVAGIEGRSPLGNGRFDLWNFYDGVPEHQARLVFDGGLPWWTAPDASHAFFRPLSSALLVAVHALAGRHAAAYYALLLVLVAGNVLLAARLFDRWLPRPASAIALAVFAVHALGVDATRWISALHLLLSTAGVLAGWIAYTRWREDGWAPGKLLAVAGFAAGLLAGEAALGALAYVVCRELASPRKPGRAAAVAMPLVIGIAYVVLYRALHRGAHAIDGYLDPLAAPGRAAAELADRFLTEVPRLLTAPAERGAESVGALADAVGSPLLFASAVLLAWLAFSLDRPALRACGPWAAAALLCALPGLLGPTDRALYPSTLGAAAVVGLLVGSAWGIATRNPAASWIARGVAIAGGAMLVVAEVGVGAAVTLREASAMVTTSSKQLHAVSALQLTSPADADVVVLLADGQMTGPWGGLLYAFATGSAPRSWQALAFGAGPTSVGRVADDTIEIAPRDPTGFAMHLYRDVSIDPMHAGDRVVTRGLVVEVAAVTPEGRPSRIRVRADRSLDDPALVFAARGAAGLVRVHLPPVGMGVWLR